jgi:membrane protein implicated in regulation of membrane protease activity
VIKWGDKMEWDIGTISWFILTVVFIGIEIAVPALVSIWFACAALILTLISKMVENSINEFYIFVVLSGIFLILTRPISKKLLEKRKPLESRIIGQEVKILKKIDENLYEVKLDGKYWKAICSKELEVGEHGIVEKIEGNKLVLGK